MPCGQLAINARAGFRQERLAPEAPALRAPQSPARAIGEIEQWFEAFAQRIEQQASQSLRIAQLAQVDQRARAGRSACQPGSCASAQFDVLARSPRGRRTHACGKRRRPRATPRSPAAPAATRAGCADAGAAAPALR
jgi:hypothetical protein